MGQIAQYKNKDFQIISEQFANLTSKRTFELECSFALQHINKSNQLLKCTKVSLLGAVMNVANFELSLNPIKHQAYLVPFYNRNINEWEAVLMIGYQGIIDKICATGAVRNMEAVVVYTNDNFEVLRGTNPSIVHSPAMKERGKPTHVYCVAFFPSGGYQFEVMQWSEVEEIRNTSQSWKSLGERSIWGKHLGEMAKKTVVRRLAKYLPKNGNEDLRAAVALDDQDFKPEIDTVMYTQSLLSNCTYDDETIGRLEIECDDMSVPQINQLIIDLQQHQKPPEMVTNPNQKDIGKIVTNAMARDKD